MITRTIIGFLRKCSTLGTLCLRLCIYLPYRQIIFVIIAIAPTLTTQKIISQEVEEPIEITINLTQTSDPSVMNSIELPDQAEPAAIPPPSPTPVPVPQPAPNVSATTGPTSATTGPITVTGPETTTTISPTNTQTTTVAPPPPLPQPSPGCPAATPITGPATQMQTQTTGPVNVETTVAPGTPYPGQPIPPTGAGAGTADERKIRIIFNPIITVAPKINPSGATYQSEPIITGTTPVITTSPPQPIATTQ